MKWQWMRVDKSAADAFKKRSAHVGTENGAEIWRDQMGFSRLFKEHNGYTWVSDRDFLTIKEAKEEANR